MKVAVLFVLALGWHAVASAQPAPIAAASCKDTDIQAAVNAAVNGQTVTVPAGNCTFTVGVTIPATKGVTISTAGQTNITGAVTVGNRRLFTLNVQPGNAVSRVTGFALNHGFVACGTFCSPVAVVGHGRNAFRVDNNIIDGIHDAGVVAVASSTGIEYPNGALLSGLIDHNRFKCHPTLDTSCHPVLDVASPPWDAANTLAGNLAAGWGVAFSRPIELGSDAAIYVEDNVFDLNGLDQDGLTDTFGAAQIVFRFNASNGSAPGNHGFDSAGYRAPRWFETYRNKLTLGADNPGCGVFRGGGVLYFDNVCGQPAVIRPVALTIFRARPETFFPVHVSCNGGSSFDGNLGSGTNTTAAYPSIGTGQNPGWPCLDQTGWHFDADGGAGFVSLPGVLFNNSNGAGGQVDVSNYEVAAGNIQNYLKHNQDFYIGNPAFTGASTVGNKSTGGVGRGLLSARPTTCTTGVFYWATDQGTWNRPGVDGPQDVDDADGVLYRCSAPNTWATYYTPYAYPHPLITGSAPIPPPDPTPIPPTPSIDTEKPTFTMVVGRRTGNNYPVTLTNVIDNVGVAKVELYVDNEPEARVRLEVPTSGLTTYAGRVSIKTSGSHTITAKVYDLSNNQGLGVATVKR